ncbi:phospholipase A2 inhibitor PIP-like [Gopherus flavomarginatus]|uniref:phospholipase A2 inhibitor PIP-like n=1 Tax=Gopherus flavomarginatus TaxID=286002 RepID=UPI0021CBCEC5|nr:phospholipase A2 inhibitor PIP-like [Gopherus flavomarginatus]
MVSFILCLLPALLATSAQASTLTCKTCSGSADACRTAQGTCRVDEATGGCYSMAEDFTTEGEKTTGFASACLDNYNIGIKGPVTVTLGNGTYLRINTTLCNTDNNCNSPVPEVPTGSTTENGLQCPTCLDLNSATCNSIITPCAGDETYCIAFTGTILNGKCCQLAAVRSYPGNLTPQELPRELVKPRVCAEALGSSRWSLAGKGCATASAQDITPRTFLAPGPDQYLFSVTIYIPGKKTPTAPSPTNTALSKTTRSGAGPALGKFSFALYLPGLIGLLLVKLLS